LDPHEVYERFANRRLPSALTEAGSDFISRKNDIRIASNDFVANDTRFENSLKFLPIWCEAFVLTSLVWTFAPLFNDNAKKELNERFKAKILK